MSGMPACITRLEIISYSTCGAITSAEEKLEAIVKSLSARGHSRPRKVKTLTNTINALFSKTLEDKELIDLIEEMKTRNLIVVENENVNYKPPISQP